MVSQTRPKSSTGGLQLGKKWTWSSKLKRGSCRLKSRPRRAHQQATSLPSIRSEPNMENAVAVRFSFIRVTARNGSPQEFWQLRGGACYEWSASRAEDENYRREEEP